MGHSGASITSIDTYVFTDDDGATGTERLVFNTTTRGGIMEQSDLWSQPADGSPPEVYPRESEIQDIQDTQGKPTKHTEVGGSAAGVVPSDEDDLEHPMDRVLYRTNAMIPRLTDPHERTGEWVVQQLAFELARYAQGFWIEEFGQANWEDQDVEAFEDNAIEMAEYWGLDKDEAVEAFYAVWHKVRAPHGQDAFNHAVAKARANPTIEPVPPSTKDFNLAASIAYHLQVDHPDQDIQLPVERLGKVFGKSKMHGTNLVARLLQRGLVVCTDPVYRFKHTPDGGPKGKDYRFVFDSGKYRHL